MYSCNDTLAGGLPHSDIHGSTPARGSPWLFAACHVLHRLLVPRHPPNALLILDIPASPRRMMPHHAQKPSSENQRTVSEICVSAHIDIPAWPFFRTARAVRKRKIHPATSFTTSLNPRRRPLGRCSSSNGSHSRKRTTIPGQTSRPNDGTSTSPDGLIPITRAQRRTRT